MRKLAYNELLYYAMLEIRGLQGIGNAWWHAFIPPFLLRRWSHVRYCGHLADALHNLAFFSSWDYEGFDEDYFWSDLESLESRFPGSTASYRGRFQDRLAQCQYAEVHQKKDTLETNRPLPRS